MRSSQLAALVVIAALPAYTQHPQIDGNRAEILALAAHSDQRLPAEITGALTSELRRIFVSADLQPEWHPMPGLIEITSVWEPVNVYLHGECRLHTADFRGERPGQLAFVERTDGELRPHIHVDCVKLVRFLQQEGRYLNFQRSDVTVGRALARVLAHELLHYLTSNPNHGDSELFARTMAGQVLLKHQVDFNGQELIQLRKATDVARSTRNHIRRAAVGD